MSVSVNQEQFINKVQAGEYEMQRSDEVLKMDENKTLRSIVKVLFRNVRSGLELVKR